MVENTSSSLRREMTQVVIIVFTSLSELLTSLRRKKVSFADLLIDLLIKNSSGGCIQLPRGQRNWENICDRIAPDQQLVTMFSESYSPINCRYTNTN